MQGDARSILITGGTGLVGSQLVRHFLTREYLVITTTRKNVTAAELADNLDIDSGKERLHVVTADLVADDAAAPVLRSLEREGLRPVALVNNARNLDYLRPGNQPLSDRQKWLGEFQLDVVAAYELSMALVGQEGSRLTSIINIASIYGMVAPNRALYDDFERHAPVHYGVAKAALIHLTREMAVRLADRNIRVNAVSYGGVEGRAREEFVKRYSSLCPSRQMVAPEDVVGSVEFLASEASRAVTGHNLVVDGGWTVW